ncbi:MAG: hypothetical protein C5B51_13850 [Terriglobia bacterium]|nr:MAG: hypothetical protein C5B51_13850 [Terriglobia bacterium]
MNPRNVSFVAALAASFSLASGIALAQSKTSEGVLIANYKTPNYKAPRTPDGQPDLQGVWANNSATPLQRPKALEGKEFLSEKELTSIKRAAEDLFKDGGSDAAFGDAVFLAALANAQGKMKGYVTADGKVGDYSSVWTVNRDFTNRTSLIIDPKDGMLPALTARAQELAKRPSYVENESAFGQGPGKRPDGPEDLGLSVRCISFGTPRIGAGYNSYMQIVQSAKTVVVLQENIHDARVIPLDGSPHPPASVKTWNGDSRGHWEGDTLVVDTTNYRAEALMNNSEKLHIVERFQRSASDYLTWTVTFEDPDTWVKPWTVEIPLRHTDDALIEYACHEGNYGMQGILAGARAADAAEASGKTGSGSR